MRNLHRAPGGLCLHPVQVGRLRDWAAIRRLSNLKQLPCMPTLIDCRYITEDVLQCNNEPSSATARGHQFPAAFMAVTRSNSSVANKNRSLTHVVDSGVDKCGISSETPLPYTHLDIAGRCDHCTQLLFTTSKALWVSPSSLHTSQASRFLTHPRTYLLACMQHQDVANPCLGCAHPGPDRLLCAVRVCLESGCNWIYPA